MESAVRIPRLVHRIWLGDAPLPELFAYYGETWAKQNPTWEVRLWTDRDIEALPCAERVAQGEWISERSDLLRYELLGCFGGVYVDTDMECLRPIDPLLRGVDAFAAWEAPDRLGSAILGATAGHPAIELALEHAYGALRQQSNKHLLRTSGPVVTRAFSGRSDVTIFGLERFYPPVRRKEARWLSSSQSLATSDMERLGELANSSIALTKNAASLSWPDCTYAVHHVSGLGRERFDTAAEIDRLNSKLEKARAKERRLRDQLNAIKASRWWRISAALRLAPSRAGKGGSRSRS